jgi:hypothetical protein
MKKELTLKQVQKKYKGKYIEVSEKTNWDIHEIMYTVHKVSRTIRENMTLAEDLGTNMAYRR